MSLYMEFVRIGLFDHDAFVKDMIKYNEHNLMCPLYACIEQINKEKKEASPESPSKEAVPEVPKPVFNHNSVPDVRRHKGLIVPKSRPKEKHSLIHDDIPYKHLIILQVKFNMKPASDSLGSSSSK